MSRMYVPRVHCLHSLLLTQTVYSRSFVLVTGATGFIGAHIVDELLRRGIRVRGTTRSQYKADEMLRRRQDRINQLEFTITSDLAQPGIFDEAIKGVDAAIHTASVSCKM